MSRITIGAACRSSRARNGFISWQHPVFYNPPVWEQINSMKFDAVEERSLHGEFPLPVQ
jgi:hypothetical protein